MYHEGDCDEYRDCLSHQVHCDEYRDCLSQYVDCDETLYRDTLSTTKQKVMWLGID